MVARFVVDLDFAYDHNGILRFQGFDNLLLHRFLGYRIGGHAVHFSLIMIVHFQALHDQTIFAGIKFSKQQETRRKFGKRGECAGMQAADMIEVALAVRNKGSDVIVTNFNNAETVRFVERHHAVQRKVEQAKLKG